MFNMTRPVIEGMRERGFGRIIIISSINGQKGQMGQANYSAAKAGVIGFAKALAQENANKGITVNVIAPGYIGTEMVQAVPEEVLKTKILPLIPVGRLGEAGGDRPRGRVPRRRRGRLHHRLDAHRQWRPVHGLTACRVVPTSRDCGATSAFDQCSLLKRSAFVLCRRAMTTRTATAIGFIAILLWSLLALFTAATGNVPPFQLAAMTFLVGGLVGAGELDRAAAGLARPPPEARRLGARDRRPVRLPRLVFRGPAPRAAGGGGAHQLSLAAADRAVLRRCCRASICGARMSPARFWALPASSC